MRCENVPPQFPEEARHVGQTFAEVQSRHHFANHDPDYRIRKSDVIADINDVQTAIARFLATPASAHRDFAIHVLMDERADGLSRRSRAWRTGGPVYVLGQVVVPPTLATASTDTRPA